MAVSRKALALLMLVSTCPAGEGKVYVEKGASKQVSLGPDGKLVYGRDERGNRLPDFSWVGYHDGEEPVPEVKVQEALSPRTGDNTRVIQDALDKLGKRTPDRRGHRGALLLKKGVYRIEGRLTIAHSGVVLRGEGPETILVAAGYGKKEHRRTLISVGNSSRVRLEESSKRAIADAYVPVGAQTFSVESTSGYRKGDRIIVFRPSTDKWIRAIGGHKFRTVPWKAGAYDFRFERTITDINRKRITVDAPVVHALDKTYGGGAIYHYEARGRVTEVGIEDLHLVSEFGKPTADNPYGSPKEVTKSEMHGWDGIRLNRNTENTWVRRVSGNYFGWSLVSAKGKSATVTDCVNLGHASKITGGRRYPFMIDGQRNLVQRCVTYYGRHEFVSQARTAGPNVFVDCRGFQSKSSAGPHHRYSVGTLFDNIRSEHYMESRNRGNSGSGHGWAGTQTCFYNCVAPSFKVQAPPGGISWVIGCGGERVAPPGLYYQQVLERLGKKALDRLATEKQRSTLGQYEWVKKRR